MRRLGLLAALFSITVLPFTFGGFVTAQSSDQGQEDKQSSKKGKDHEGHPFTATMTGAAEIPGPGDTDGAGTGTIMIHQGQSELCYEITVSNIATATAAHIHKAAAGQAGAPVVTLKAPAEGSSKDCVKNVDAELMKDIGQNPSNYYVNVHNAEFPNGAVRGQLAK